jgi:hypothetical protein
MKTTVLRTELVISAKDLGVGGCLTPSNRAPYPLACERSAGRPRTLCDLQGVTSQELAGATWRCRLRERPSLSSPSWRWG